MDKCSEKLGNAVPPIFLYPAYMVGVPFRPKLPSPYVARGIFPASIPERPESSLSILCLLERESRTRTLDNLHVHYLPPALRLWLVGYFVAIGSRLTIGSHDDGCCGSDYWDNL